jgi:hypothetical protein
MFSFLENKGIISLKFINLKVEEYGKHRGKDKILKKKI